MRLRFHSMALSGRWEYDYSAPDERLQNWLSWLEKQDAEHELPWPIGLAGFRSFVEAGLRFQSEIPPGYGLGSSGALVAAFVDRWSKVIPESLDKRRHGLGLLESYFHGNSSGLDPLVSLQKEAIHLLPDGGVIESPNITVPDGFFLVDTGLPRKTSPLVQQFRAKIEQSDYRNVLQQDLMPRVSQAITAIIGGGDTSDLKLAYQAISSFQATHFKEMIPAIVQDHWSGQDYDLKLCGAGGGGFFLGFSYSAEMPDLPFRTIPLQQWLSPHEQR
jgi:mevalonate kinase